MRAGHHTCDRSMNCWFGLGSPAALCWQRAHTTRQAPPPPGPPAPAPQPAHRAEIVGTGRSACVGRRRLPQPGGVHQPHVVVQPIVACKPNGPPRPAVRYDRAPPPPPPPPPDTTAHSTPERQDEVACSEWLPAAPHPLGGRGWCGQWIT